jgi:hypothetical protein
MSGISKTALSTLGQRFRRSSDFKAFLNCNFYQLSKIMFCISVLAVGFATLPIILGTSTAFNKWINFIDRPLEATFGVTRTVANYAPAGMSSITIFSIGLSLCSGLAIAFISSGAFISLIFKGHTLFPKPVAKPPSKWLIPVALCFVCFFGALCFSDAILWLIGLFPISSVSSVLDFQVFYNSHKPC